MLLILSCLALGLLWWGWRHNRRTTGAVAPAAIRAQPESAHQQGVNFRPQGERGMGGPLYGDVLCADGVYLPMVWENEFHTAVDGRWIHCSRYDQSPARLVDRKSRRLWPLTDAESAAVSAMHWRLPRWEPGLQQHNGVAEEDQPVFLEAEFEAWLAQHLAAPAQDLVAVLDLWVPAAEVPEQAVAAIPVLAQPDGAALSVSLERHWPTSLRGLRWPLEPLADPSWQIHFNGQPQPWGFDACLPLLWRPDGKALAFYGYPLPAAGQSPDAQRPQLRLVLWSAAQGWQQWTELLPADHKHWALGLHLPGEEIGSDLPPLRWEGRHLLQAVEVDTPEMERLHDGRYPSCVMSQTDGCRSHSPQGRPILAPIPRQRFAWLRDAVQPENWCARSEPVQGQPLIWSLARPARDLPGATAAYQLQAGERQLPGLWELEHLVVQGRWAVLRPAGKDASTTLWLWDGLQLQSCELPGPVHRISHLPQGRGPGVQLWLQIGVVEDQDEQASQGVWRWAIDLEHSGKKLAPDQSPVYRRRELAPNAKGEWRLRPGWREVQQAQHPCADGDYVWRSAPGGDELCWLGGLNASISSYWNLDELRWEGVSLTRSGAVLCGTGPHALPHPDGDGWWLLELVEQAYSQPHRWRLHWLRPALRQVHSLEVQAWMPQLQAWDAQGLHWIDAVPGAEPAAPVPQLIAPGLWAAAALEPLQPGPNSLWLRSQDLRYVETLLARDDWPWARSDD